MDFAGDLAVFFNPEEHGEAVHYEGVGEIAVIWDRPGEFAKFGSAQFTGYTNVFRIPRAQVAQPTAGGTIAVIRTGERFEIVGVPQLNRDGTIWACGAEILP